MTRVTEDGTVWGQVFGAHEGGAHAANTTRTRMRASAGTFVSFCDPATGRER